MKRTPLLFAALVPFVATAASDAGSPTVDQQELKDDYQVTSILGAEVQSSDGSNVGTVEDVVFDRQGNISSVLVQREDSVSDAAGTAERETEQGWEATQRAAERGAEEAEAGWEAATQEDDQDAELAETGADDRERADRSGRRGEGMDMTADADRADTMEMGDDFASLQWSDVSYDAAEEVLRLSGDASSSLQSVQYDQSSAQAPGGEVRASKLVGLEVNLSDEESFGEVEDVMIDTKSGKASAIVVDSMEFFDKERYAVPVDLESINAEEEALTLQFTAQQVKDMGEFEMGEAEPVSDQ